MDVALFSSPTWYYIDSDGHERGPFRAENMLWWYNDGYLPNDLMVKSNIHSNFISLSSLEQSNAPQPAVNVRPALRGQKPPFFSRRKIIVDVDPSGKMKKDGTINSCKKEMLESPGIIRTVTEKEYIEPEMKEECLDLAMKEKFIKPEIKDGKPEIKNDYMELEIKGEGIKLEPKITRECIKLEPKIKGECIKLEKKYIHFGNKRQVEDSVQNKSFIEDSETEMLNGIQNVITKDNCKKVKTALKEKQNHDLVWFCQFRKTLQERNELDKKQQDILGNFSKKSREENGNGQLSTNANLSHCHDMTSSSLRLSGSSSNAELDSSMGRKFSKKEEECQICSNQLSSVCHPHISTLEIESMWDTPNYFCTFCKKQHPKQTTNRRSLLLGSGILFNIWKEAVFKPTFHIDFDCIKGGKINDVLTSFLYQSSKLKEPLDVIIAAGNNNIFSDSAQEIIFQLTTLVNAILEQSKDLGHVQPSRVVIASLPYTPKSCDPRLSPEATMEEKVGAVNRWIEEFNKKTTGKQLDLHLHGVSEDPRHRQEANWDGKFHFTQEARSLLAKELIKVFSDLKFAKWCKEYCIADVSCYKENKIGLRWRTEPEVVQGKGLWVCGTIKCQETINLRTCEVNFGYLEKGKKKKTLVKVRMCNECSSKLNYRHKRWKLREVDNERYTSKKKDFFKLLY